jgi:hypothetical protein
MTAFRDLLARQREANQALAEAEQVVLDKLVAAKEAHRADPTPETLERKRQAVEDVQALRAIQRADRPADQHTVGGDAFLSPEQIGG